MGSLPKERVTPSLPFTISGVDYGGQFILRDKRGRDLRLTRLLSKAIDLEVVTDFTTSTFIAAFHSFCTKRGKPLKPF